MLLSPELAAELDCIREAKAEHAVRGRELSRMEAMVVRRARLEEDASQLEIAEVLGVTRHMVAKIEKREP